MKMITFYNGLSFLDLFRLQMYISQQLLHYYLYFFGMSHSDSIYRMLKMKRVTLNTLFITSITKEISCHNISSIF